MNIATDEASLKAMLKKPLQNSVNQMFDKLLEQNEKKIEETIYRTENGGYPRTGEFKEAWKTTEKNIDVAGAIFEYDPSEIHVGNTPWITESGAEVYAQHQSVVTHEPSAEELADYLYLGHKGIWRKRGRNAFKKLDKWFDKQRVCKEFEKGLKANNVKVVERGSATKIEV